ncbi:unnamed protein product [Schistosoma curassoni]|uniref:Protein ARV n=1 Tax=Schistosoma curassoni TaxID=6186 RepID=A0A183KEK7_9TREM|nr:unnamed protein product [Schistosoma curassoni]
MSGNSYHCIYCNSRVAALYTQYAEEIIKMEHCPRCGNVSDKYIEYDLFLVIIDLLIGRLEAYRHVIHNVSIPSTLQFYPFVSTCVALTPCIQSLRAVNNLNLTTAFCLGTFICAVSFLSSTVVLPNILIKMITFLAFLVLYSTFLDTCLSDNRVSVTLVPKWKNTPLLAEASEYVARESNYAFWRFLDLISKDLDFIKTNLMPPADDYLLISKNRLLEKRVKELAIQAISATSLKNSSLEIHNRLFTLSVSSRMFSPTVEMSHQLALTDASYLLNCSRETVLAELASRTSGVAWVLAGSEAVFSIDKLKESIEKVVGSNSQPTLFSLEKVYSSPKDTSNNIPTVILYGDLSHHEFYSWHRSLKALSDDGL